MCRFCLEMADPYPFEVVNIKVECVDAELEQDEGDNSDNQPGPKLWEAYESSSHKPAAILPEYVNNERHKIVEVKLEPTSLQTLPIAHQEKEFPCRHCKLNFSSAEVLKLHSILHKMKTKRDRTKPSESSEKRCVKREHGDSTDIHVHSGSKYQCEVCEKNFKNKSSLIAHRKVHKRRMFRCDNCNKAFSTKAEVATHLRKHGSRQEGHVCIVCFHVFTKYIHLQGHLKSHQQDGFDTNMEESAVVSKFRAQSLQRQSKCVPSDITAHDTKPTYKCSYCLEVFVEESECKMHETGHLYTCNICGKQFKINYCLKLHMRTHTGEKPYGCDVCPKKFVTKSHLSRHMRGHEGLKPHHCNICNVSFTRKFSLRKHARMHLKSDVMEEADTTRAVTTPEHSKGHRVSLTQKQTLLDFMEQHHKFAIATSNSAPSNSWRVDALWEELALALNNCVEGCTKTWQCWRNYWTNIKSKTKKRVSEVLAEQGTRAGANRVPPLNDEELRINAIVTRSPLVRNRIARRLSKNLPPNSQ